MYCLNNSSFYTVFLSTRDVSEFASRWPCFGDIRPVWFQFNRGGDLVDMSDTAGMDESGVLAMSHDAQHFGLAEPSPM